MKDELQNTMERPKKYDNIDGTGEMFFGLMILGFALFGYLQTVLPEHSMWRTNVFAPFLLMYGVLLPTLGFSFLLQRVVKKHLTWPRTGYVARHSVWRLMFTPRPARPWRRSCRRPYLDGCGALSLRPFRGSLVP